MFEKFSANRRLDDDIDFLSASTSRRWISDESGNYTNPVEFAYTSFEQNEDDRYLSINPGSDAATMHANARHWTLLKSRCHKLLKKLATRLDHSAN
jgi:hypothetical protein